MTRHQPVPADQEDEMYRPPTHRPRHERALLRLLGPVLHYLDARFDRLENLMASAEQTYTDAWAKYDADQLAGFAELSTRIGDLTAAAQRSGDDALLRAAARVDAARDSLSAAFSQFRSADETPDVPADLPPVINPETPPVDQADPAATDGLPVDAQAVVDDPGVVTA